MTVHFDVDAGVAVIRLDNPPLNIYDLDMRDRLIELLGVVRDLPEARALVITSSGAHLGAGADLGEFGTADSVVDARRIRWDRDPWRPLIDLSVPTIAVIRGVAYGSALEMAMMCDLRFAGTNARLSLPETRLGMLPAAGGTQTLTKLIGAVAALPLVATAAVLDAHAASAAGLVSDVVEDPEAAALEAARGFARLPRRHWAAVRIMLRAAADLPLEQGLEIERRQARLHAATP